MMDGAKFNSKGHQGYNRKFARNRREDNSYHRHFNQENNMPSQGGKVNSVRPQYSSFDNTSHLDMKSGKIVLDHVKQEVRNKDESKPAIVKGKDGSFHDQHTQKGQRSNVKHDESRRKYNYSKEKANRPFKAAGRSQNRGNEMVSPNDETRSRKQPCKNESGSPITLKRNENINASISSTPQHLKPAVHVQPLQQVSEKAGACDPTVKNIELQTTDASVHFSNQGNSVAEGYQKISSVDYTKETIPQVSSSRQPPCEQASSVMKQTISGKSEAAPIERKNLKENVQKSVVHDHSPVINPIFQTGTEARSLADLNSSTSGLGGYLSSSICSSFAPAVQTDLFKAQSNPPTNQNMLHGASFSPAQLALAQDQSNNHSKKFLAEENLMPLSERSKDVQPALHKVHDCLQEPTVDHTQNSEVFQVPRDRLEAAESLQQNLAGEKYGYRISVDSLFSTSFFTNPQANVNNKKEMAEIGSRDNHVIQDKTSSDTVVLSNLSPRDQLLNEAKNYDVVNPNKMKNTSLHSYQSLSSTEPNFEKEEHIDPRHVSPRCSKELDKSRLESPPPVLRTLAPHVSLETECASAIMKDPPFSLESTSPRTYRNFPDESGETIGKDRLAITKMSRFSREDNSRENVSEIDVTDGVPKINCTEALQEPLAKHSLIKNTPDVQSDSLVNLNYREIPKRSVDLQDGFSNQSNTAHCPTTTETKSLSTKVALQSGSPSAKKDVYEKPNTPALLNANVEDNHVHRGPFPQAPFLPNPFIGHSLLTHRQAIPSAFVYPSRVGMPGTHSGFTDVTQHTANNPTGTPIFPPHGTTVYLNIGGRIFEIIPSTFSPYPESLLCQIFTGATPAPINQRGHIFFDRDGYLFEIILAFARVGYLSLPPNVNLPSLMNEAKYFGMYEYMFQKGQVASENILQFQRTTRCTLQIDDSTQTTDRRAFVLQRDDKLKIESLHVCGACCLYVDLYTPLGVKETSNFVIYTPDKPDIWKAYQFCAERQLVFHLERADSDTTVKSNKSSVDIIFSQTFVFVGDEFVP